MESFIGKYKLTSAELLDFTVFEIIPLDTPESMIVNADAIELGTFSYPIDKIYNDNHDGIEIEFKPNENYHSAKIFKTKDAFGAIFISIDKDDSITKQLQLFMDKI